jgi:hypothetical protein
MHMLMICLALKEETNMKLSRWTFEPVAKAIAASRFKEVTLKETAGNRISVSAHEIIQTIMNNLSTAACLPTKQMRLIKSEVLLNTDILIHRR